MQRSVGALTLCFAAAFAHGFVLAPHRLASVARPPPRAVAVQQATAPRTVVVTDMDETLIASKSTGYIIQFLVNYGAFLRLAVSLPFAAVRQPRSPAGAPQAATPCPTGAHRRLAAPRRLARSSSPSPRSRGRWRCGSCTGWRSAASTSRARVASPPSS